MRIKFFILIIIFFIIFTLNKFIYSQENSAIKGMDTIKNYHQELIFKLYNQIDSLKIIIDSLNCKIHYFKSQLEAKSILVCPYHYAPIKPLGSGKQIIIDEKSIENAMKIIYNNLEIVKYFYIIPKELTVDHSEKFTLIITNDTIKKIIIDKLGIEAQKIIEGRIKSYISMEATLTGDSTYFKIQSLTNSKNAFLNECKWIWNVIPLNSGEKKELLLKVSIIFKNFPTRTEDPISVSININPNYWYNIKNFLNSPLSLLLISSVIIPLLILLFRKLKRDNKNKNDDVIILYKDI